MLNFVIKIVERLLRRFDYFIVAAEGYTDGKYAGCVINGLDEPSSEACSGMVKEIMTRDDGLRRFILDCALKYLRCYEVDTKNFVQELYAQD